MAKDARINDALQTLLDGNKRFAAMKQAHPNQDRARRDEVSAGQKPFAVIVGCSDSRIPPEILFDQGIGDLFIIRLAGNIVDDIALGSIEYAVDHLGTPLVVVLGHSKCGAVTATAQGGEAHGHIGAIANAILPALENVKGQSGDLVDNAIRENAKLVTTAIASSKPILEKMVKDGKIAVIPLYYDIDTGLVEKL
ncbi:MAG: Carbonic anhydrase 2 [Syntrophorhabdus sp. PtaB.Bin184]|jgi:carbonic anhydrase|nr:MAG: Carbonic anhydrase 2 [Syntrophorhabdus sp. PtaB.Bin184]